MNDTKHIDYTFRDWSTFAYNAESDGDKAATLHIKDKYGTLIARAYKGTLGLKEAESNARLLAASPKLFNICTKILELHDQSGVLLPDDCVQTLRDIARFV